MQNESNINRRSSLRGFGKKLFLGLVLVSSSAFAVYGIGQYKEGYEKLHDLTVVGNGLPTVVQVHDTNCKYCQALRRSGSVCLNNFPRTISEALWVHNSAELSTAADGACDVPADAVGNSGRTNEFHSMRPLPILAGSHSRPHPAFDPPGWSVAVPCCTNQCGARLGPLHQPRWHRRACTRART